MRAGHDAFTAQVDADGPATSLPAVNSVQRYYLEMTRRGIAPSARTRLEERLAFGARKEQKRTSASEGGCRCGNPLCGYVADPLHGEAAYLNDDGRMGR